MDEIWGRGQKIYKNHIHFDPRGVRGGGRAHPPPPTNHRTICKDKTKVWARLTNPGLRYKTSPITLGDWRTEGCLKDREKDERIPCDSPFTNAKGIITNFKKRK